MNQALGLALAGAAGYVLFVRWRIALVSRSALTASSIGPHWLVRFCSWMLRSYSHLLGISIVSESGEGMDCDKSRRYIISWHPHGFLSWCPLFLLGDHALSGRPHGRPWFGSVAPILFKIPLMGECLTLMNGRPVDKRCLNDILNAGGSIAIQPGGVKEQAATLDYQEQAIFSPNLGFIRLAIMHGVDLLPVYLFGENQLYKRVHGMEWLTKLFKLTTGMTLPVFLARFGIPVNCMFPLPNDIHIRWGAPVTIGPPEPEPSDERIEEVFSRYVAELRHIFDMHAERCLPPQVAKRGLRIIRLDGKPVP